MPRFQYPTMPVNQEEKVNEVAPTSPDDESRVFPDSWERKQNIPVNRDIVDSLQVGDEVVVTLRGKVAGLSNNDSEGMSRNYLEVSVNSVEAYPDDMESEEDFVSGYIGED